MKKLEQLAAVIPPPSQPRQIIADEDWLGLFKRFGTRLPQDFVQYHKVYGAGFFYSLTHKMTACLEIYGGSKHQCFEFAVPERLSELRLAKERRPKSLPFPLYWEPNGLLPWGARRTTPISAGEFRAS